MMLLAKKMPPLNCQQCAGLGVEMRSLFWLILSALFGIATHLGYVLFVPSSHFKTDIDRILGADRTNAFTILDPTRQSQLMPFAGPLDLVGVCKFDVGAGLVTLSVEVPKGYWTFAVYTLRGQQVYALNDRQADAVRFNVRLEKTASLIEQVSQQGGQNDLESGNLGWQVKLSDPQGLAFLWMPHGDAWHRAEAERSLRKSVCKAEKSG
jgi:uncharacterized membrane protein